MPKVYYFGDFKFEEVIGFDVDVKIKILVTDYVYGAPIDFNMMKTETKAACIECVQTLHAANIKHGDLRYPNFIVNRHNINKPVLIDFGLSRVYEKMSDELKEELDEEMRQFKANF